MTKVVVRWLLLDWNHWMSVHAMNFYFYLWLLKILWPGNTSSHICRHLKFIIEQGHRGNWVSGWLDSRVTGSMGHKMWPSSISATFSSYEPDSSVAAENWTRRTTTTTETVAKTARFLAVARRGRRTTLGDISPAAAAAVMLVGRRMSVQLNRSRSPLNAVAAASPDDVFNRC